MQQLLLILLPLLLNHPEINLESGIALAQAQNFADAEKILTAGFKLAPGDKRFPQEIAAVRFQQKDLTGAEHFLQKAYSIDPTDAYTINFLGTV